MKIKNSFFREKFTSCIYIYNILTYNIIFTAAAIFIGNNNIILKIFLDFLCNVPKYPKIL